MRMAGAYPTSGVGMLQGPNRVAEGPRKPPTNGALMEGRAAAAASTTRGGLTANSAVNPPRIAVAATRGALWAKSDLKAPRIFAGTTRSATPADSAANPPRVAPGHFAPSVNACRSPSRRGVDPCRDAAVPAAGPRSQALPHDHRHGPGPARASTSA